APRSTPAPRYQARCAVGRGPRLDARGKRRDGEVRQPTEDHDGLHRMPAPELHHGQEPPERPRPNRAQEVLPVVPGPHAASRDPLATTTSPQLEPRRDLAVAKATVTASVFVWTPGRVRMFQTWVRSVSRPIGQSLRDGRHRRRTLIR